MPPLEIQEICGFFTTYRIIKKQTVQSKNQIHSLLKEKPTGSRRRRYSTGKTAIRSAGLKAVPFLLANFSSYFVTYKFDVHQKLAKGTPVYGSFTAIRYCLTR